MGLASLWRDEWDPPDIIRSIANRLFSDEPRRDDASNHRQDTVEEHRSCTTDASFFVEVFRGCEGGGSDQIRGVG